MQPSFGLEGRLPLVSFPYANVVVPPPYIQFGVHEGPTEVAD